ncbi:hypothetical protein HanRHA438_Chr11g0486561 [Helianthus annuus]|nr:hypothetical protein HanRHA438_Chr11g0486561 [Helianthus annuus]
MVSEKATFMQKEQSWQRFRRWRSPESTAVAPLLTLTWSLETAMVITLLYLLL